MRERITLESGGRQVSLEGHVIRGVERYTGLMFTRKNEAEILIFKFRKPTRLAIHSFFVFFPFMAIWLDEKGRITEKKKIQPFSPYIIPRKDFKTFIEIPLSRKYMKIVDDIERFK